MRLIIRLMIFLGACNPCLAQPVVVSFSWYAYGVNETNACLTIVVNRGGDTNVAFTVDYATGNGTATAGLDYTAQTGTLNFVAGVNSRVFKIPILGDGLAEGDETFTLQLSNPSNGVGLGVWPEATIYLTDNEFPSVVDPTFNPGAGSRSDIHALALQPDGRVIIGGQFSAFDNTNRSRIARLHPDGSLDLSFDPGSGADGDIYALALQPDGKVLIGGRFAAVNDVANRFVARLNPDGSVDTTFMGGASLDGELRALAVQPDGRILIAGVFTSVAGQSRGRVARLNADGTLDTSFNPGAGANNRVRSMALQSNGRILIGGLFTTVNDVSRPRVARLLANGTLDTSFNPGTGADDQVRAIAVQDDGKIYIGGDFEIYNGVNRSAVARLFADGSLDPGFDQGDPDDDVVRAITVQPGGQVWIGGFFTTAGGMPRRNLALLDANGLASAQFSGAWSVEDEVFAIVLQSDGRILIGGEFHDVNGVARSHIARVLPDWSTTTIGFTALEFTGYEAAGAASITVQRHGQSSNAVSVTYATADGTAIAGVDYAATSGTLNFGPLETVKSFSVPLFNIGSGLPARTVQLSLGSTSAGMLPGPLAKAVLNITNNAGQIDFSGSSVTVGEERGHVVLTLVRRGEFSQEVTVDYATSGGMATANVDFGALAGSITFPAESNLVECNNDRDYCFRPRLESYQYIVLPILNDGLKEPDENFTVTLSNPRGGAILGGATNFVVTIRDNDPGIGFAAQDIFTEERFPFVVVRVIKQWDGTNRATVDFRTQDATATAGLDYVAQTGTLVFEPNEFEKTITIPVLNDTLSDHDETFHVVLSNPVGGPGLGLSDVRIIIWDCDDNGLNCETGIQFTQSRYAINQGGGNVTVFVRRDDDGTNAATVDYVTRDGTARAGFDYVGQSGTLTFPNGQTTNMIVLQVLANGYSPTNRTFTIDLTNVDSKVSLGAESNAVVKILGLAQPGEVDLDFNALFYPGQSAIAVQRDGKVLVAAAGGILRLNQDGSRDASFNGIYFIPDPFVFTRASVVLAEPDGRILYGGAVVFSGYHVQAFVSRLEADGAGDNKVILGIASDGYGVRSLQVQEDGKVLAGGHGGYNIVRLNPDFMSDSTWSSETRAAGGWVESVASQPDGKIFLGGNFTDVNGDNRNRLARLNHGGTLDETFFNPGTNNGCDRDVHRVAVLPGGKILAAGQFSTIQGGAKPFLARLNGDGTVDTAFPAASAPNGGVFALAIQTDGKIVIGGDFTKVGGLSRPHVARLLPNGAVDETFDPGIGPDGPVYDIAVLPDGDLIIFGGFNRVNGIERTQLARLHSYQLRLEPPVRLANGDVRIPVHGQTTAQFVLQASDDLVNWFELSTNTLPATYMELLDTTARSHSHRFYRMEPPLEVEEIRQGDQIILRWTGGSGRYQVQRRNDPVKGKWHNVGHATTATTFTAKAPKKDKTVFYRVQSLPNP